MNQRVVYTAQGGPEVIRLVEEPDPLPRAGEVRIRVSVAGVAYGDILPRRGVAMPWPTFPMTPGYDIVGVVEGRGQGAGRFALGERVAALPVAGGYQRLLCLPESELVQVPPGPSDEQACAVVLNYVTAYQMLVRAAALPAGSSAFVYGLAGGVGSAMAQLARLLAIELHGTASGGRLAALKAAGQVAFDRHDPQLVRTIRAAHPKGYDAVFDPLGGASLARSHALLGRGGQLVLCGAASAAQEGRSPRLALLGTMARLAALKLRPGHRRVGVYAIPAYKKRHPRHVEEDLSLLLDWLAAGRIRPEIAAVMPLADAARAQALLEEASTTGKILLRP